MMEKQGERWTDVLSSQRENRIVKDFHNTILRCTDCQLKRIESYKRKEGKRPFSRGTGEGRKERGSTEISWPKNAHPQSNLP